MWCITGKLNLCSVTITLLLNCYMFVYTYIYLFIYFFSYIEDLLTQVKQIERKNGKTNFCLECQSWAQTETGNSVCQSILSFSFTKVIPM